MTGREGDKQKAENSSEEGVDEQETFPLVQETETVKLRSILFAKNVFMNKGRPEDHVIVSKSHR